MTKTIKGWTALADADECKTCGIRRGGDYCFRRQFWELSDKRPRVTCYERLVPATLTYEVSNDNG